MSDLYWPIYKNLERETLNLADLIHFSDKQINVYSVRIADMIVRSLVEIESLINDLYKIENAIKTDKVGEKLNLLNEKWKLEDKQVTITSLNMHFSDKYSTFSPFKYKEHDTDDYYSAYNAIKHDRAKNFEKKATLHYLMRSLAALYILNIYFQNKEIIPLGKNPKLENPNFGSDIFSAHISVKNAENRIDEVVQDLSDRQAIYILRVNESQYKSYQKTIWDTYKTKKDKMIQITENGNYNKRKFGTNFIKLAEQENISDERYKKIVEEFSNIDAKSETFLRTMSFEAILNKNQVIYPAIDKEEK